MCRFGNMGGDCCGFCSGEFKALPWSQSTAYNSYLMRDVHRQFASRQSAIQQAFTSPAGMQEYLEVAVNDINK